VCPQLELWTHFFMTGRDVDTPKAVRRLKHWPILQKCRIVEETFVPGASVAAVARRNNANANQVFEWRKLYRQGRLVDKKAARGALPGHDLIRIGVVDHDGSIRPLPVTPGPSTPPQPDTRPPGLAMPEPRPSGIVEIELSSGIKVRVDAGIDEAALRRVLAVIMEIA
jgi:transposase